MIKKQKCPQNPFLYHAQIYFVMNVPVYSVATPNPHWYSPRYTNKYNVHFAFPYYKSWVIVFKRQRKPFSTLCTFYMNSFTSNDLTGPFFHTGFFLAPMRYSVPFLLLQLSKWQSTFKQDWTLSDFILPYHTIRIISTWSVAEKRLLL